MNPIVKRRLKKTFWKMRGGLGQTCIYIFSSTQGEMILQIEQCNSLHTTDSSPGDEDGYPCLSQQTLDITDGATPPSAELSHLQEFRHPPARLFHVWVTPNHRQPSPRSVCMVRRTTGRNTLHTPSNNFRAIMTNTLSKRMIKKRLFNPTLCGEVRKMTSETGLGEEIEDGIIQALSHSERRNILGLFIGAAVEI